MSKTAAQRYRCGTNFRISLVVREQTGGSAGHAKPSAVAEHGLDEDAKRQKPDYGYTQSPQTLDFGYLAWHLGPEGGDPVATGFDVAIVRNDVIAELYTVITT